MIIAQHVTRCVTTPTACLSDSPLHPRSPSPHASPPRSVWGESHHHLRGGVSDYTRSRVRCPQTRLLLSASIIQRVHTLRIMSHNGGGMRARARTPVVESVPQESMIRTKYRILERKGEWQGSFEQMIARSMGVYWKIECKIRKFWNYYYVHNMSGEGIMKSFWKEKEEKLSFVKESE